MSGDDAKKTVLVVDDTPSNIQTVNSILKELYKVRIATNGPKALELVKVAPAPDLVLLDVMMPGMDGYDGCTPLERGSGNEGYTRYLSHQSEGSGT